MSSVHHVEIVAAYVGRVWGAILLALSVTVIEVGIILAIMFEAGSSAATLGRDTVFAAVMITVNGIIGFSVVAATLRSSTSSFNSEGSGAALGAIATIATLGLVLPTFTSGSAGPTFTEPQLIFVALVSLGIYALFLWVLTVRNREHFEDIESPPTEALHLPPTKSTFVWSLVLLVVSLGAIIGAAITMYASVATRTGEIGTLRALGFRRGAILSAFLLEALLLSLVGAAVGLLAASFLQVTTISTTNFNSFSELAFSFRLTPGIVLAGTLFALLMGLVGGVLPAIKASRMKIVDALRAD